MLRTPRPVCTGSFPPESIVSPCLPSIKATVLAWRWTLYARIFLRRLAASRVRRLTFWLLARRTWLSSSPYLGSAGPLRFQLPGDIGGTGGHGVFGSHRSALRKSLITARWELLACRFLEEATRRSERSAVCALNRRLEYRFRVVREVVPMSELEHRLLPDYCTGRGW